MEKTITEAKKRKMAITDKTGKKKVLPEIDVEIPMPKVKPPRNKNSVSNLYFGIDFGCEPDYSVVFISFNNHISKIFGEKKGFNKEFLSEFIKKFEEIVAFMKNNKRYKQNNRYKYRVSLPGRLFAVEFMIDLTQPDDFIRSYLDEKGIPGDLLNICDDYWEIICRIVAYHIHNNPTEDVKSVIESFESEGLSLDGRQGIELIDIDFPAILESEFFVEIYDPEGEYIK